MKIEFVLNGTPTQVDVRPDEWFLHTLRERCGVTSLKDGCSPQGQCGCCVALVHECGFWTATSRLWPEGNRWLPSWPLSCQTEKKSICRKQRINNEIFCSKIFI